MRLKLTMHVAFALTTTIAAAAQSPPGGHNWSNWRDYLRDFAPLLFRSAQP